MEGYVLLAAIVLVALVLFVWLRAKNLRASASAKSAPEAPGIRGLPPYLRFEKTIKKESYTMPLEVLDLIRSDRRAEAIAMMEKAGRGESDGAQLYDEIRKALKEQGKL
jgi:hypothetical protein